MNSCFFLINLFYFIIVYYSIFRGKKIRGSMDPFNILMDPVHGPDPRMGSMFCTYVLSQRGQKLYFVLAVKKKTTIMSFWYDEDRLVLTATCTVGAATIHVCKEGCHHQ